jgi:site-specific DNA recombinase
MRKVTRKISVFLRRVSTENQSLEMQISADKKFRDLLDEDEYIEVNELGVSANKVKLKSRKDICDVINFIRKGEVDTLYVYDRSRLTRNFYEYLELVDLFLFHKVNVVFTTTEATYPPFNVNYMVEAFNGILIEEEGKAIARRMADTHRKLPPQKFGYKTEKKDGRKYYRLDEDLKPMLFDLYDVSIKINSLQDFIQLLLEQSSRLKKKTIDIVRILTDPFYAASERMGEIFNDLHYVEPVLSVENFIDLQQIIAPYISQFHEDIAKREGENIIHPFCGICKKEMNYKRDKVGSSGVYGCSNKHKKVSIELDTYNETMKQTFLIILDNLSAFELKKKAIAMVAKILSDLERNYQEIENKIKQVELTIATLPFDRFVTQQYKNELKNLNHLKTQRKEIKEFLLLCENHKNGIDYLIEKLKVESSIIETEDFQNLMVMLVKKCFVNDTTLEITLYYSDYLEKEKIERMLTQ